MSELPNLKELLERLKAGKPIVKKPYAQLVREEVAKRYSLQDEIALINNYNLYRVNPSMLRYKQDYDAYQAYRQQCKEQAISKLKEGQNESDTYYIKNVETGAEFVSVINLIGSDRQYIETDKLLQDRKERKTK